MSKRQRFILGGIGGLMPIVLFVVNGTLQQSFNLNGSAVSIAACVSFLLRMAAMFVLGGGVVFLYPEVKQQAKILQLGLSAPALVAGLMTAGAPKTIVPPTQNSAMALIPVVYAQAAAPKPAPPTGLTASVAANTANLKHFTLPPLSPTAAFVKGLTSIQPTPDNVYFVIAGNFTSLDDARAFDAQINQKYPGFHADVYAPYPGDPYYSVVIGADMTEADAKTLRDKAIAAGVNKETYYRTFPNLPLPPSS